MARRNVEKTLRVSLKCWGKNLNDIGEDEEMSALRNFDWEAVTRAIAKWGSLVTAIVFGIGFLSDRELMNKIASFDAVYMKNTTAQAYMVLLMAVFVSYLFAGKQKMEVLGSLLVFASVGAIYLWCHVGMEFSPGPQLLVLALPAVFYLLSGAMHRWSGNVCGTSVDSERALPPSLQELSPAVA